MRKEKRMVEQMKAKRLSGIGEYYFSQKLREIDLLNKEGHDVLNLGIGSPDLAPPVSVTKALVDGLNDPQFHKYQSYKGIPELRKAFSDWYRQFYQVTLDPDSEILPLIGSKEGIMHVSMAFLNEGDEVLVPDPGYPMYSSATKLAGGIPRGYALKEENNYEPDLDELSAMDLSGVKIMWINYPHMPTGTEASQELLNELIDFAEEHQLILINDNPYSFTLTETPRSVLKDRKEKSQVLELNSLSKSHNMAGWRVGVLCGNKSLIDEVLTFKSNMDSGMFRPVMLAAVEALRQEEKWYTELNRHYSERKKLACQILNAINCTYSTSQAGMFVWARIPAEAGNGKNFSDVLLDKYRLFIPPGMIFGSEGEQYIRISLCSKPEQLKTALNRIRQ
ncbi:MAG: aminotransferase class I/II-fold pyridoxal phosphate-dependent enzyme [Cyclobacteriaceae bacterium]